jgi:hypothetical protein
MTAKDPRDLQPKDDGFPMGDSFWSGNGSEGMTEDVFAGGFW